MTPETSYIKKHPYRFITELILVPTFTCIPFAFFAYFRNMKVKESIIILGSIWFKLFILHFLLEVSGFYAWFLRSPL